MHRRQGLSVQNPDHAMLSNRNLSVKALEFKKSSLSLNYS